MIPCHTRATRAVRAPRGMPVGAPAQMSVLGLFGLLGPILALASGCGYPKAGPAPGPITPAEVTLAASKWPAATETSLSEGRDLFIARCNGCHDYADLKKIPEGQWPEIMKRMGKNAKLDAKQTEAVLEFVLVAQKEP